MNEFKIGDEIYHKSSPAVKWVIERIDNNDAYCSTIIKETFEQKKETFALTSIEKCAKSTIIIGKRTRDNHW